ncbi:14180_t:CDS:1, partial [Dentiscutata heterogama]
MKIISLCNEDGVLIVPPPLIENVEESLFFDHDNELATKKLQQTLDALHICNPMAIEDLLNLEKKNIEIHQQFNDNDFIQAATEIDYIENKVIIQLLTRKEQLDILRNALQIVDERINDDGVTMKSLRKLQSCIREEVRKEEAKKQ